MELSTGTFVGGVVLKALPSKDSYLIYMAASGGLMATLPRRWAGKQLRVGDTIVASIYQCETSIILTQRSSTFVKSLAEFCLAPLLLDTPYRVVRAAMTYDGQFAKVAVTHPNIKECVEAIKEARFYVNYTVNVVKYETDMRKYIAAALAPAPARCIKQVTYYQRLKTAEVYVDETWVGKFLGKNASNVATAAKLTDTRIQVVAA